MKLSNKEKNLLNNRRKYISIKRNSEKILIYRKGATQSKGERRISKFLNEEGVEFIREYFFKDLFNTKTKQLLYFDFYIRRYNLCIEFDGQQHYASTKTENEKINDFLKNAYCLKNNVHLLRIKYTDIDSIEKIICNKIDIINPIV